MNIYDYALGKFAGHSKSLIDTLINYYKSSDIILQRSSVELAEFLKSSRIQDNTIKIFLDNKEEFNKNKKKAISQFNLEISQLRNRYGVEVISYADEDYPKQLKNIKGIPLNLYVSGKHEFNYSKSIAIVGARNASIYAKEKVAEIVTELAKAGFCVVSGLARGIDGQAHSATLQANGRTIAVLPFLSERVYPPEHQMLSKEIVANEGALISENFSHNNIYNQSLFVERNRIISGLVKAVLIVEGSQKSGTLSQYNHAKRQNKLILTLKPIKEHEGTYMPHKIIKEGGIAIESAREIIHLLKNKKIN